MKKKTFWVLIMLFNMALTCASPIAIIISSPTNNSIANARPSLNLTFDEPANVTYKWDSNGDISGCRNCYSYNSTYGEYVNLSEKNLSALWHFNENSGNIVFDSSSYGNNGTLGNGTCSPGFTPCPSWTKGKFGYALDFYCTICPGYGEGDYVEVSDSASLDIVNEITIIGWIKPTSFTSGFYDTIIEKPSDIYGLYLYNRHLTFYSNSLSLQEIIGETSLNTGEWYCVAATYNGNEIKLYLNGQIDGTATSTGTFEISANNLQIGGNSGDAYFNGTIDELAIFNRALSDAEIAEFCNKTLDDGPHNVTVYAVNASGDTTSLTRYFTVDTRPPYRVDLISPSNDSLLAPPVNFSWKAYDATSNMTSNLSVDGVVVSTNDSLSSQVVYTLIAGLSDGLHNWSITTWDAAGNVNISETFFFIADSTPAQYIIFNNTPILPYDNESVTCYSYWNDTYGLNYGVVEENSTGVFRNHTVNLSGKWGWVNYTISAEDLEAGTVECKVYAFDMAGNLNATPAWSFDVKDTTPPLIANITYSPSTVDGLDPGVEVNVSADVTDFTGVDTVLLQYKEADETSWHNKSMSKSGGAYKGNFTPSEGNWSLRIWANDTYGNANVSDSITLEVEYDWTWSRSPASFGVISGVIGSNLTLGNLTLNNTGDYNLSFELSSTSLLSIYFDGNESAEYNLTSGEVRYVEVNASLPAGEGEFPVNINIAASANATPASLVTNATVIAYTSGPYLYVTIETYPTSVTQGDTGISLVAKVTNVGNESATNAWLGWELPSGWTNTSGDLNISIPLLGVTSKNYRTNSITVSVGSSAATGTQTITAIAGCAENKTGSDSVSVVVNAKPSPAPSYDGGLPPAPPPVRVVEVAPPTYAPTPEQRAALLESADTIEVVRGRTATFTIKIANPFPNTTLENITIAIEGYLEGYLEVTPLPRGETGTATVTLAEAKETTPIAYNEAQIFEVTITAPSYLEKGIYPLNITLQGKIIYHDYPTLINETTGEAINTTNYTLDMKETKTISLIVHTVSREEGEQGITNGKAALSQLQTAGLGAWRASRLLEEASKAMAQGDYERAKELGEEIERIKELALSAKSMIEELKSKIVEAEEEKWLKVIESKRLLDLALAAFEREDYATALQRVKDAEMTFSLETKGKVNYAKLLIDYWWALLLAMVVSAVLGVTGYQKFTAIRIASSLRELDEREAAIMELIRETQDKYYVSRTMSRSSYNESMRDYRRQLAEINNKRLELKNKIAGLVSLEEELESLKEENEALRNMIKDIQERYYSKKAMSPEEYQELMDSLWTRRTEVEGAIALLQAKIARKKEA
jgi:hypothetical protein